MHQESPQLQHYYKASGFSLIEVLVSLSLFTIVMTVSVGVLMVLIDANARAQSTQEVMTNLSFALDSITREIRTGSDYYCGGVSELPTSGEAAMNCPSGSEGLTFNEGGQSLTEDASSRRIALRLNNESIERRLGDGTWTPITSEDITVHELRFIVTGVTRSDAESPTVTLYIKGEAGSEEDGTESEFSVQTTVVQQLLDI